MIVDVNCVDVTRKGAWKNLAGMAEKLAGFALDEYFQVTEKSVSSFGTYSSVIFTLVLTVRA